MATEPAPANGSRLYKPSPMFSSGRTDALVAAPDWPSLQQSNSEDEHGSVGDREADPFVMEGFGEDLHES